MTDLETISVYDSKSHEYATMTNSSKPSKHLETFMREVRNGGTVLDLGCGPGNAAALMSRKRMHQEKEMEGGGIGVE